MKEMILNNSKTRQKVYIMQDLLQDGKVMTSWKMHRMMMKMQKICWNTGENLVALGDVWRKLSIRAIDVPTLKYSDFSSWAMSQ